MQINARTFVISWVYIYIYIDILNIIKMSNSRKNEVLIIYTTRDIWKFFQITLASVKAHAILR